MGTTAAAPGGMFQGLSSWFGLEQMAASGRQSEAQATGKEEKIHSREDELPLTEAVRPQTPHVLIKSQLKTQEDEKEISTCPGVSEFLSDAFNACNLDEEDLRKAMEQLVLDKKEQEKAKPEDESADWGKELQQEL
ncbi:Synapse-Associated Protein 1 [Manis pentadactyla]|nr:Synapse-Associated Protein 1 [Manis pentadactyla]